MSGSKKYSLLWREIGLEEIIFCLGIFLKQFYLFPSGSLGAGDLCFGLCALMLLGKGLLKQRRLEVQKKDWPVYCFFVCVVIINGIYFLQLGHRDYIRYSVYWLYSIMIIWSFRQIGINEFIRFMIAKVLKVSILIQMMVCVAGRGRVYYEYWGATRFMGTFNNPNQMAYIVFLMLLILYFYEPEKKKFWFYGILAGWLIRETKSTGVFLGWGSLAFFDGISLFYKLSRDNEGYRKAWKAGGLALLLGIPLILWIIWPEAGFRIEETDYSLIARIQEKIYKVWTGGITGLIYDRGWERMILYPQYLLYGGGEGNYEIRFPMTIWQSEIHSTFFSIWFCYGIIPLGLICRWLYGILKGSFVQYWPVYGALFLECMTVINYRQPFFWIVLLAGPLLVSKEKRAGDSNLIKGRLKNE